MVKDPLSALPCFTHVEQITPVLPGLSQHCYKVNANKQLFFAKTIDNVTEAQIALRAAEQGFSPKVYYHDQHWLVTDFIQADNLAMTTLTDTEKVNFSLKLMSQCHQLNAQPSKLSPESIIDELINKPSFSAQQKNELLAHVESILAPLNTTKNLVCCHGDLNFANVLVNQNKRTWLVDYECANTAPAEYDLAMFIAVNCISEKIIPLIISQYEQLHCSVSIDRKLINHYLTFSYFINSLWYRHTYQSNNKVTLLNSYQQQWNKYLSVSVN